MVTSLALQTVSLRYLFVTAVAAAVVAMVWGRRLENETLHGSLQCPLEPHSAQEYRRIMESLAVSSCS